MFRILAHRTNVQRFVERAMSRCHLLKFVYLAALAGILTDFPPCEKIATQTRTFVKYTNVRFMVLLIFGSSYGCCRVIFAQPAPNHKQFIVHLSFFSKNNFKYLRTGRANTCSSTLVGNKVSELHITGWHSLKDLLRKEKVGSFCSKRHANFFLVKAQRQ